MKIRDGFVSNSSSSCFVVAVKTTSDFLYRTKTMGKHCCDTEVHAVGRAEVLMNLENRLRNDYELDLDHPGLLATWEQTFYDQYQLLRVWKAEGYDLAVVELSIHQRKLWDLLHQRECSGDVLVLNREEF